MFTLNGLCAVGRGYVANDIELRYLNGGNKRAVVEVPVSFQRFYKNSQNEYVRNSHFVPCVFYGNQAERLANAASKGTMILVTGYVEQESFTIKGTDKKASRHRLVVEDFSLCENPTNGNGNGNGNKTNGKSQPANAQQQQGQDQAQDQESQAPPVNKQKNAAPAAKPEPQPEPAQDDDGTTEETPDLPF